MFVGPSKAIPVIIGVGAVTPIASTAEQTWIGLLAGQYLHRNSRCELRPDGSQDRLIDLSLSAAREAIAHSQSVTGVSSSSLPRQNVDALIVGTSKGPIDDWLNEPDRPRNLDAGWGISSLACKLSSELRINGPALTVSGACASGLHALIRAVMLIRSGQATRVLVVAVESSFHPLILACYRRLGVLADPEIGCRPFDLDRAGFFVSEAAAAVLLEATPGAMAGALATIDRFAFGGDATHITGSDPAGYTLARLLRQVIVGDEFDLIHAHGTGTPVNDVIELAALESVLTACGLDSQPALYSHKGAIGHTLGASGLLAVVLNCLAHRDSRIPPNIQTRKPLGTASMNISAVAVHRPVRRSVCVAAGFGGATAVVGLVRL